MSRPMIGYALSGGAVRGAAHLGFLSVFEEAGIRPDVMAGTSAGAVVGAGYAAGVPVDVMSGMVKQARWRDIAGTPSPQRLSVFSATPLRDWIAAAVGELTFEELQIPLAVVACNVVDGTPVLLLSAVAIALAMVAGQPVPGWVRNTAHVSLLLVFLVAAWHFISIASAERRSKHRKQGAGDRTPGRRTY